MRVEKFGGQACRGPAPFYQHDIAIKCETKRVVSRCNEILFRDRRYSGINPGSTACQVKRGRGDECERINVGPYNLGNRPGIRKIPLNEGTHRVELTINGCGRLKYSILRELKASFKHCPNFEVRYCTRRIASS